MAQNQIRFGVGFNVDSSSLMQVKSQLQELSRLADFTIGDSNSTKKMRTEFSNLKQTISQVDILLDQSFNKDLGTLNIAKFNQGLKTSGLSLSSLQASFNTAGTAGQNAFRSLTAQILTTKTQVRQTQEWIEKMSNTMANTLRWSISSSALNAFTGSIQQAYSYAKNLDESLNNIRIVTEKSADEMERFARTANKAAKGLGASTVDYTNAALIYYQQGLSDAEVQARTDVTLKAANVTGQSADIVSEQLTAVWNGYKTTSAEAELYIDKLAAVAASTAADLEELSTGMSKVASAANSMGVDVDQLNAQLATIISVTRQAPESVGTALKTIYARMGDLQLGEADEEGVQLGDVSAQLDEVGISILDAQGNLRDIGTVTEEVAAKWQTWTEAQRQAVAIAMAGKRQYNNLIALFENWDMYEDSLATSVNSMGTLQKQQDIYIESTEAHLQRLSTSIEGLYDSLLDSDAINVVSDILSGLVGFAENFVDSIGGGLGVLTAFGSILTRVFSQQLAGVISHLVVNTKRLIDNTRQAKAETELMAQASGLDTNDARLKNIITTREKQLQYSKAMSTEESNFGKELIQNTINLYKQQDALQKNLNEIKEVLGLDIELEVKADTEQFSKNIDKAIEKADENLEKLGSKKNKTSEATGLTAIQDRLNSLMSSATAAQDEYLNAQSQYIKKIVEENATEGFSPEFMRQTAQEEIQNYRQSLVEYNQLITKLGSESGLTEKETERFQQLKKFIDSFGDSYSTVFRDVQEKTSTLNDEVDKLIQKLDDNNDYELFSEEDKKALQDAIKSYKELSTTETDQKKILDALTNVNKKYNTAVDNAKKTNQKSKEALEGSKLAQDKLNKSLQEGALAAQQFEKAMKLKSVAKNVIDVVSAVGSLVGSVQSLVAIGNVWSDTEASLGDKITQTITGIGMTAPILLSQIKNITDLVGVTDKLTAAQKYFALASQMVAKASKEQGDEGKRNALIKELEAWATNKLSDEEAKKLGIDKVKLANGDKDMVQRAARILGINAETVAVKGLGAAIWSTVWPLLIVVGVLAVLAIGVTAVMNEWKKYDNALADAIDTTNNLANAYNNIQSAYDSLKNSVNNYRDLSEGLDGIIKGTVEWKEALLAVNNQVISLIQKYPELAAYVRGSEETGALEIDEAGLDMLLEEQLNATYSAQRAMLVAQNQQSKAQQDVDALTVSKQIGLSWWDPYEVYALTEAYQNNAEVFKDAALLEKALEGTALDHLTTDELQNIIKNNTDEIQQLVATLDVANKQQQINNELIADSFLGQEGGKQYTNNDYKDAIVNAFQDKIDEDSEAYRKARNVISNLSEDQLKQQYVDLMTGYRLEGGKIKDASGNEVEWNANAARMALTTEAAMQNAQGEVDNVINAVNKLVELQPENKNATEEEQKNIKEIRQALASFAGNNGEFVDLKNLTNKQVEILENLEWSLLNESDLGALGYASGAINVSGKVRDYKNTFEDIFNNMAIGISSLLPAYMDGSGAINAFWEEFSVNEVMSLRDLLTDLLAAGLDTATYEALQNASGANAARVAELIAQQDWSQIGVEEQFNKLLEEEGISIDPDIINNFVTQIEILKGTIANFDLSEDQKRIAEVNKIMSNLKLGDIIDKEQYEQLGTEAEGYFSLMADGTYMLIQDAERLNQVLKEGRQQKYLDAVQEAQDALNALEKTEREDFSAGELVQTGANLGFSKSDIKTENLNYFLNDLNAIKNAIETNVEDIVFSGPTEEEKAQNEAAFIANRDYIKGLINKFESGQQLTDREMQDILNFRLSFGITDNTGAGEAFYNGWGGYDDLPRIYDFYLGKNYNELLNEETIDQTAVDEAVKQFEEQGFTKVLSEADLKTFNELKKAATEGDLTVEQAKQLQGLVNQSGLGDALIAAETETAEKTLIDAQQQYGAYLAEYGELDALLAQDREGRFDALKAESADESGLTGEERFQGFVDTAIANALTKELGMSRDALNNMLIAEGSDIDDTSAVAAKLRELKKQNSELEIQNKLVAQQQEALDDLADKQGDVWGTELLNNLAAQINAQKAANKELETEIALTKLLAQARLQAEAQRYGFDFDINSTSMLDLLQYEVSDEFQKNVVDKSLSSAWEAFKESFKNQSDTIKELEDTLSNGIRNAISLELEKLDTDIQIRLDFEQAARDWNEFTRTMARNAEDDFGAISSGVIADFNTYYENGAESLQAQTNALNNLLAKGSALTAEEQEKVKEYQQGIMDSLTAQIELIEEMEQTYLDALSNVSEVAQQQIDELETVNGLYEQQLSLIELLDKKGLAFDFNDAYSGIDENIDKQIAINQSQLEYWMQQQREAQAIINSSASDDRKQLAEEELEIINENIATYTENYYSLLQTKLENLQEWFADQTKKIFEDLNQSLFGTDMDWASEEWDLMAKQDEQFLDRINSEFEIQKLERKYRDSIDSASSLTSQNKLNKLMDEELKKLREKDKLSQYEVDRANMIYDLTLKQIALEEAQQNKSKMRLRRDASGNYSYQFVADADEISKAEQELLEAQNALYNFDLDNYKSNLEEAAAAYQEYVDKVQAIATSDLDEEEKKRRIQELTDIYSEVIDGYVELGKISYENLGQSAEAALKEMFGDDAGTGKSYIESEIDQIHSAFANFTNEVIKSGGFAEKVKSSLDITFENLGTYEEKVGNTVAELNKIAENPDKTVLGVASKYLQDIADNTNDLKTAIDTATAVDADLTQLQLLYEKWEGIRQKAVEAAEAAKIVYNTDSGGGDLVNSSADALGLNQWVEDTKALGSYYEEDVNRNNNWTQIVNENNAMIAAVTKKDLEVQDRVKQLEALGEFDAAKQLQSDWNTAKGEINNAINENKYGENYANVNSTFLVNKPSAATAGRAEQKFENEGQVALLNADGTVNQGEYEYWKQYVLVSGATQAAAWLKEFAEEHGLAFATGGYTGAWGDSGKLAMLHEKELVLNKTDTAKILSAVELVRNIDLFNSSLLDTIEAFMGQSFGVDMMRDQPSGTLEQIVQIEANFPNVQDKNEIEEAFNELINLATQRANTLTR